MLLTKVIPTNKQDNNSPTEIDTKEENILENYTSDKRKLSERKPDISCRASGKIYVSEHYWEEKTQCLQAICHMILTINVCMSSQ